MNSVHDALASPPFRPASFAPRVRATSARWGALSVLPIGVTAISAVGAFLGLLWPATWRDQPADMTTEGRAWHFVTLAVAIPLAAYGIARTRAGVARGRVVLAGVMAYFVYAWLEFAVIPPFTPVYLVYVLGYATAIVALVGVVSQIDLDDLPKAFDAKFPRRLIAGFSFAFSGFLALMWLTEIGRRMFRGEYGWPQGSKAGLHVVQALDLGLIVPLGLCAGILLLRRRPAGYLLGGIGVVKSLTLGSSVVAMIVMDTLAGNPPGLEQAIPLCLIWAFGLYVAARFFGSMSAKAAPARSV